MFMENNNTFKTIMWIILGLAVVIIIIVLLTKDKKDSDENMVIGEAIVEEIEIVKLESFPVQVNILAKGFLADNCTTLGDTKQSYANNKFSVLLQTKKPLDAEDCSQVNVPFDKTISLSGVTGLAQGTYMVDVNGVTGTFSLEIDNFINEVDPLK